MVNQIQSLNINNMGTTSKSFITFLAGAATAVTVGMFLKSETGKKFRQNFANQLKNISNKTNEGFNSDWITELEENAINSAKRFKSKVKF
ncbi:hypothetical protein GCM10011506_38880 [Marivirga lumbricoides]|uniref:YtxH domain-containing protein n=2 Tax=Marivirga lumbricoides TaxID=1046115 RepID=A0ABQ1N5T8_9BACT|nr:hypothetical protein GCM10011506_38880 [Marivirga lumbricoides]